MTKEDKAKLLVLILQSIGCKVIFNDDEDETVEFTYPELITEVVKHQIKEHRSEIENITDSDFRLMSINQPKGAVGYQLKNMINKYYPDIDCAHLQSKFDEFDARGHEWCDNNKHKIIVVIQTLAQANNINFEYRQALTIVKRAISDARKSFIS
jgi:hypothetical protein